MQYLAIKQEEQNGKIVYVINAIPLKNKNKSVVQKIPHPLGSDFLVFEDLEEAKKAVSRAGFSYILPDGKKEIQNILIQAKNKKDAYSDMIFDAIKDKVSSTNSNVCASAILAISEFPMEETFEILFDKIGEENDSIRKNAICGICRYGKLLQDRIIDALSSTNWVCRNSAITCIANLVDDNNIDIVKFIKPLVKTSNDVNPIVQSNALTTLALVYQAYQKKDLKS